MKSGPLPLRFLFNYGHFNNRKMSVDFWAQAHMEQLSWKGLSKAGGKLRASKDRSSFLLQHGGDWG